jgi:hypothetical protein
MSNLEFELWWARGTTTLLTTQPQVGFSIAIFFSTYWRKSLSFLPYSLGQPQRWLNSDAKYDIWLLESLLNNVEAMP